MIGQFPLASHPHAASDAVPLPQYPKITLPSLATAGVGTVTPGGAAAVTLPSLAAAGAGVAAMPVTARLASRWRVWELTQVLAAHIAPAALREYNAVAARHAAPYAISLAVRHASPWSPLSVVRARHSASHGQLLIIRARHSASHGQLLIIRARHSAAWSRLSRAATRHVAASGSITWIGARHVGLAALLVNTPARARHVAPASMHGSAVQMLSGSVHAEHDGRTVTLVDSIELSLDDGAVCWSCDLHLADATDYARVALGDAITLHAYGTEYALVVIGRQRTRGLPPAYTLSCQSPAVLLGSPWSAPITLGTPTTAHATVEALLGQSVTWDMIDWRLPTAAASLEDTPLGLARTIVGAAGGRLESLPDGSLSARAAYPVSVPAWGSATPTAAITDADILAHSDSADAPDLANRLTITSGDSAPDSDSVRIESELHDDDPHTATVRAYPWPWRPITLAHTGDAQTRIGARSEATTEHEVLAQVQGGSASTGYPVDTLLSASWQYANLGGYSIDGYSIRTTDPDAYGQLALTFESRCWQWTVSDPRVTEIQFLALED